MMTKIFNGPAGVYVYEEVGPVDHKNTTTVTFRLSNGDVANLKHHLRNVVFGEHGGATIDTDYYDHTFHAERPVNLSDSYRVISDMASQISDNYPNPKPNDR